MLFGTTATSAMPASNGISGRSHASTGTPAARRDQRQIAGELDGVAEPLFGVHQDGSARRIAAIPLRSGQIDEVAAEPVMPLAPLVLAEAEGEVARPAARPPPGSSAPGRSRAAARWRLRSGDGLIKPPARGQHEAQAGMRLHQRRCQTDRLPAVALRIVQSIEVGAGVAEIEQRGGIVWIARQAQARMRRLPGRRCPSALSAVPRRNAASGWQASWHSSRSMASQRFGRPSVGEQRAAQVHQRCGVPGPCRRGTQQRCRSLARLIAIKLQQAVEVQRLTVARGRLEYRAIQRLGVRTLAGALMVDRGEQHVHDGRHAPTMAWRCKWRVKAWGAGWRNAQRIPPPP